MKLTKLIFVFALAIAAVGCNKDDDNNTEPYKLNTTNFVDTYSMNFLELKVVETVTLGSGATATETTTTKGSSFGNVNFVFNADGTFAASGLYIVDITIVHPDGTSESEDPLPQDAATEIGSGTYSLNTANSKVTITDSDGKVTAFDITKYTETEMRLYSESTTTSENSSTTTTVEYRFSR